MSLRFPFPPPRSLQSRRPCPLPGGISVTCLTPVTPIPNGSTRPISSAAGLCRVKPIVPVVGQCHRWQGDSPRVCKLAGHCVAAGAMETREDDRGKCLLRAILWALSRSFSLMTTRFKSPVFEDKCSSAFQLRALCPAGVNG